MGLTELWKREMEPLEEERRLLAEKKRKLEKERKDKEKPKTTKEWLKKYDEAFDCPPDAKPIPGSWD